MITATSSFFRNRTGSAAILSASLLLGLGISSTTATAQSVATVPVGAVTVTIAAGTGTTRVLTPIGFALFDPAVAVGQMSGTITSVTANTIKNSNAAWTAGSLSAAATPYLIQVTSGTAKGRIFLISVASANTADTLTIDGEDASLVDLTTVGIVSGDTYKIFACDTIGSLLGTPETTGVRGGTTVADADMVQLLISGAYRQYFYNTNLSKWVRAGLNSDATNVAIRPDSGIQYFRLAATPLSLTLTGEVCAVDRRVLIKNSGVSAIAAAWPTDGITLATSGLQSSSGWVSSTDSNEADLVLVYVSGSWRQYFHDGTNWRRVGLNTVSNTVVIAAGSSYVVNKKGVASGSSSFYQTIPYSL